MNRGWFFLAFLYIFLATPFLSAAFDGGTITMCVGDYCSSQPTQSPLAGTGQADYDNARYQAYRRELNQQYQQAVNELQQQTQEWAQQQADAQNMTIPEFNKVLNEALGNLEATIPDLPADLPTWEQRRIQNPYPSDPVAKQFLDDQLDEIWAEIKSQSPKQVAAKLDDVFSSLRTNQNYPDAVNLDLQIKADFLHNELIMSKVIDGNGLINAPYVEPLGTSFRSNPSVEAGFNVRRLMNQNISNESAMKAKCFAGQASETDCAIANDYSELMRLNILAADRWAAEFRTGGAGTSLAFQNHMNSLEIMVAFGAGFVEGVTDAIEGMAMLIAHPIDSVEGLSRAVYNIGDTYAALEKALVETWDEYQNGDATVRARIAGKVGFEVISALVPVSKVKVLQKMAATSKGATAAISGVGKHVLEAGRIGIIKGSDQALAMARLLKNSLNKFPGESIDNMVMASADYFHGWRKSYKHLDTMSAEALNEVLVSNGDEIAWKRGSKVFEFETTKPDTFYRVYNNIDNKIIGRWILHKEDIVGLSPLEIKNKFAIPGDHPPKHLAEVSVPPGTRLNKGRVGKNKYGGDIEGAVQYELLDFIPDESFNFLEHLPQ